MMLVVIASATYGQRSWTLTNYLNNLELDSLIVRSTSDTVFSRTDTLRTIVHNGASHRDTLFGKTGCFASPSIQQGTWLMADGSLASALQGGATKYYVKKKVNDSTLVMSDTVVIADTVSRWMRFKRPEFPADIAGKPFYMSQWDLTQGLPTVAKWVDSTTFIASRKPLSTVWGSTAAWASFACYKGSNTQSGAGDFVGLPMSFEGGYGRELSAIFLTDSSGQSGNVDVAFFSALPAFDGDNAAAAISASEMRYLIAYVPLTTSGVSGSSVMYARDLNIPLTNAGGGNQPIWVYLISRGTQTYTGGSPLRVRLIAK